MFKKLLKGVFALGILFMLNNPAQAFYTDMLISSAMYTMVHGIRIISISQ